MALPLAAATSQPPTAVAHYVDCAFNFNDKAEAFLFTADQCLQFNFNAPSDYIIRGPLGIGNFFSSLRTTIFAQGIDSAFTSTADNNVYMFRNDLCVLLNFVSGIIMKQPIKIAEAFTSLKDTIFEKHIDAAFASHQANEVYIFNGDQCALINIEADHLVSPSQKITIVFPSLIGTVFADGLDAGFRAKTQNEAFIFKGNRYAIINYVPVVPETQGSGLIYDVSPISKGFQSLNGTIPHYI